MTPAERDAFMRRYLAVWQSRPLPDETVVIWHEHLNSMQYTTAVAALNYLEKNSRHRPALSDFHEAYAAQRHAHPDRSVSPPVCGMCEDGRVAVRCVICDNCPTFTQEGRCPKGPPTSMKCPNGCKPLTPDERAARDRADDDKFKREKARAEELRLDMRVGARDRGGARDPSGPNDRDDNEPF